MSKELGAYTHPEYQAVQSGRISVTFASRITSTKVHGVTCRTSNCTAQTSSEQNAPWFGLCVFCDGERRPLTFGLLFVPFLLRGDVTDYVCIITEQGARVSKRRSTVARECCGAGRDVAHLKALHQIRIETSVTMRSTSPEIPVARHRK
jgi:hypothetical protein